MENGLDLGCENYQYGLIQKMRFSNDNVLNWRYMNEKVDNDARETILEIKRKRERFNRTEFYKKILA